MQVRLCIVREVKVYDHVNGHDIDTSGEDVCANEAPRLTIFEVMVDPNTKNKRVRKNKNLNY